MDSLPTGSSRRTSATPSAWSPAAARLACRRRYGWAAGCFWSCLLSISESLSARLLHGWAERWSVTDRAGDAALAIDLPAQWIDDHPPRGFCSGRGVVDDVFGLVIRSEHDAVVAGAENLSFDAAKNTWGLQAPEIGEWPHGVIGHAAPDAVELGLPVASAIK